MNNRNIGRYRTYQCQGQPIFATGRIEALSQSGEKIDIILKVFLNATSVFSNGASELVSMMLMKERGTYYSQSRSTPSKS